MDVTETLLPGVGVRYEFVTSAGSRLCVVVRRSGEVEIVSYADDPDAGRTLFHLTPQEADTVAEILGAPRLTERFADLTKEIPGLHAGRVPVPAGSAFVNRPLGDTRARTRTGASIVAIVRDDDVLPSPGPEEVLHGGDTLVAIGTQEGIAGVTAILEAS